MTAQDAASQGAAGPTSEQIELGIEMLSAVHVLFEVASNWAELLLRLFSSEIARSAVSYAGEIERGSAGPR